MKRNAAESNGTERSVDALNPRLALAYGAQRRSRPGEFEVELAVNRIQARMQRPPRRRSQRAGKLALALLSLGGLAYAATQLGEGLQPEHASGGPKQAAPMAKAEERPVPQSPVSDAASQAEGWGAPEVAAEAPISNAATPIASKANQNQHETPRAARAAPRAGRPDFAKTGATPEAGRAGRAVPEPTTASWNAVAQAMSAADYQKAQHVLEQMTRGSDAATRENARLGLAQLAMRRGDCEAVRRLSQEVMQAGDATATARRRARELWERCSAP